MTGRCSRIERLDHPVLVNELHELVVRLVQDSTEVTQHVLSVLGPRNDVEVVVLLVPRVFLLSNIVRSCEKFSILQVAQVVVNNLIQHDVPCNLQFMFSWCLWVAMRICVGFDIDNQTFVPCLLDLLSDNFVEQILEFAGVVR